jgi:hypothetical protein
MLADCLSSDGAALVFIALFNTNRMREGCGGGAAPFLMFIKASA